MKRALLFAACSALTVALTVVATSSAAEKNKNNNSGNNSGSGQVDDKTFAQKASAGNLAEINMAQLAMQRANNPQLKQYGQRLLQDHTKANQQLNQILGRENIQAATEMNAKHKECWEKLASQTGQNFDQKFVEEMIKDHKHDIKLYQHEAKNGKNAALKQYAEQTLPVIEEHLKLAQNLSGNNASTNNRDNNTPNKANSGTNNRDNNRENNPGNPGNINRDNNPGNNPGNINRDNNSGTNNRDNNRDTNPRKAGGQPQQDR